jgi:hypothetical protein
MNLEYICVGGPADRTITNDPFLEVMVHSPLQGMIYAFGEMAPVRMETMIVHYRQRQSERTGNGFVWYSPRLLFPVNLSEIPSSWLH